MAVIASGEVPIAIAIFYWLEYGSNQVMGSSHTLGKGVMQGVTHGGVVLWWADTPSILQILLSQKSLRKRLAEASTESNEDVSEETEDLEPLEPDDSGKKVTPSLHSCLISATNSWRASLGQDLSFSIRTVDRKVPAQSCPRQS